MRLGQIQKRQLVTEGWNDPQWTLFEQREIHPWVASVEQYVFEANLSQDQINQLFTSVEQGATAAGGNRTLAGKAADVAKLPVEAVKWIDTQINKLGGLVQKAGPVKNADAKFEELKQKIGTKDNKVVNAVKKVSDWAKANPGKASIAVGILTAAAAVAGGPLGGAVAGFLARATKDLLQGEKLSTAVGKSVKTAAYGALAGAAIQGLTDNIIGNIATGSEAEANAMMDGFEKANFTAAVDKAVADAGFAKGALDGAMNYSSEGNINGFFYNYNFTMTPDQVAEYKNLLSATQSVKVFSPEYYEAAGRLHGFLSTAQQANADLTALARTVADIPKDMLTGDQLDAAIAVLDNADAAIEKIMDVGGGAAAAAQGALQTVDANNKEMHKVKPISAEEKAELEGGEPKESKVYKGQKLSEGQVYLLFNRLEKVNTHMLENKLMFESVFEAVSHYHRQTINEGPLDALKGAASKVGGALKKGAQAVGKGVSKVGGAISGAAKQVTTKVTAEKLNAAWKKAGSPTDSDEIYDIIKGLGVADDVIKGTYDSMKIQPPAATDAPDADQDQGAADAETNADAPTDSTAGDGGSDTTDTGAVDSNTGGDEPAATDDGPVDSDATTPGVQEKDKQFIMVQDPKDETKYNVVDSKTQKVVDGGAGLDAGSAEEMRDTKNAEVVSQKQAAGGNAKSLDAGSYDEEHGVPLTPQAAQEFKKQDKAEQDEKIKSATDAGYTQNQDGSFSKPGEAEKGATDADTASTSGDTGTDTTTTPQSGETPATDTTTTPQAGGEAPATDTGTDTTTTPQAGGGAQNTAQTGQNTAQTGTAPAAGVDLPALAKQIKQAGPQVIDQVKTRLAA